MLQKKNAAKLKQVNNKIILFQKAALLKNRAAFFVALKDLTPANLSPCEKRGEDLAASENLTPGPSPRGEG